MARGAIDIGNTTEETVNVNETQGMPVEETEPAENIEKKRRIQSDHLRFLLPIELKKLHDEATKLECLASDIEKCTVEKGAVVAKTEPANNSMLAIIQG